VDYRTILLTNFSAIIRKIVFVPLSLIRFLSSIKKIVPIVVTSLRTQTISYTVTGKRQVRKNLLVDQIFLQTLSCFQWTGYWS